MGPDGHDILILQQRVLLGRAIGVDGVTWQGRVVSVCVPFQDSTAEQIGAALELSADLQDAAYETRRCALLSWEADLRNGDALDDSDTDPTVG